MLSFYIIGVEIDLLIDFSVFSFISWFLFVKCMQNCNYAWDLLIINTIFLSTRAKRNLVYVAVVDLFSFLSLPVLM